jgi:hypothetical protein
MELFLNILWLFIAFGLLGLWRTRWARQQRLRRPDPLSEWTAFSCTLVLLFFAVSMTDDLHFDIALFDECSAGRRHSVSLTCHRHAAQGVRISSSSPVAILTSRQSFDPELFSSAMAPINGVLPLYVFHSSSSGRSPPAFSLSVIS